MKKYGYCINCDFEFNYIVNNINDLNNVICPKCNKKINIKNKKIIPESKTIRNINKVSHNIINFWYYFYFIFSLVGLIGYHLGIEKLLIISSVISLSIYFIELLIGFNRNIFGLFGLIISTLTSIFIMKDIFIGSCIGICYLFLISGIIKIIINAIISKLYKKYG